METNLRYNIGNCYLDNLLKLRGIKDVERFKYPSAADYENPLNLDNIIEAKDLYLKHINQNNIIDLIIDSDVDGFTSSAIFYNFTKKLNPNITIRYHLHTGKQHGLEDMIDILIKEDDIKFVVCPDSSSNDYEQHKDLHEIGVDVLVLDHHEIECGYSPNAVVVNNQESEKCENKGLSGATLTYKFVNFVASELGDSELIDFAKSLIDLAAVGGIGDMMNVTYYENRYLFTKGLKHITNKGLERLILKQAFSLGDTDNLTPTGIAFYIVPLMNALIRVGSQKDKEILFRSLIEGDLIVQSTKRGAKEGDRELLADQSARNCVNAKSRQTREKDKFFEYFSGIIESEGLNDNKILLIENDNDNLNTNLTGLVAMQIMNIYNKPVLLVKENAEGYLRGSIRADSDSAMKDFKGFLENSGLCEYVQGHASAAGVSLNKKNKDRLIDYANEKLKDFDFSEGSYLVDFEKDRLDNTIKDIVIDIADGEEYWGQGLSEPLISVKNITLTKTDYTIIGRSGDTIKFIINGVEYIMFKASKFIKEVSGREHFTLDIVGTCGVNSWMGKDTPQIQIKDYQVYSSILDF